MLKKLLIALLLFVAIFCALVSQQPDEFRVSRSGQIAAAPNLVFPYINNLKKWREWSPWIELDPDAKISYEGPEYGVGASNTWSGNDQVGEGRMTIIESVLDTLVKFRLDFVKPFEGTSTAEFNLASAGNGTEVTWSMYGKNNFIGKAMGLIMDCEKMVGSQFEKGLANLKRKVESGPTPG